MTTDRPGAAAAEPPLGDVSAETKVLEAEERGLAPNEYRFVNRWRVIGDLEEVSAIIGDPDDYHRWWPCAWLRYKAIQRGGEGNIGGVFGYKVKGWMPYSLSLRFTVVDVRSPHGFTVDATGDLVGRGIWTLVQQGRHVELTYEWRVRADRALIRRFSGLLKPLFRSNHYWVMRNGARSLQLELERRRATGPEALARIPAPPGPTFPENLRRRLGRRGQT
jgi:hypothetical protein